MHFKNLVQENLTQRASTVPVGRSVPEGAFGFVLCLFARQADVAQQVVVECGEAGAALAQGEQARHGSQGEGEAERGCCAADGCAHWVFRSVLALG